MNFFKINKLVFIFSLVGCQTPRSIFEQEVKKSFAAENREQSKEIITEEAIGHLPFVVQRYLKYVGVVNKPPIISARIKQRGLFKTSLHSNWKKMIAEEYYFPNQRSFFWYGDVKFFPLVSAYARDKYDTNGIGNVYVKLANVLTVANGQGPEFNISCLIRYLNELVWFPSAFLDPAITWSALSEDKAMATISLNGVTTSAILHFNELGEMILFESNDRYASLDGGKLEKAPWITPMRHYKEFDGYKIPTEGEAIYILKEGKFEYGKIIIEDMQINRFEMYE